MMRWFLFLLVLSVPAHAADPAAEFFERKVRPLLAENCFACHGPDKQKAGLRLDSRSSIAKGGDTGPALDIKNPEMSLLLEVVGYSVETKMPPKAKMPDDQIAILKEWVKQGAIWPNDTATASKVEPFDLKKRAGHWSLQPIKSVEPPAGKGSPIDRFLTATLKEKGLKPSGRASKEALLRRLTFDLTGLPPTIEELDAFLADASPEAYAKQVDRLLASPRYGEQWARHWLDVVRYAETMGHEFDIEIPEAWKYRDYVIRAFKADVPYNQFVKEHLAGDQTIRFGNGQRNEAILGTGFWFLHEAVHAPVDVRKDQADRFDNQIDVFGKAFLGTTIACARCHDHKFDAISTKDYYALFGMLESSRYARIFEPIQYLVRSGNPKHPRSIIKSQRDDFRCQVADAILSRDKAQPALQSNEPDEQNGPNRLPGIFPTLSSELSRMGEERGFILAAADAMDPIQIQGTWLTTNTEAVTTVDYVSNAQAVRRSKSFTIDSDFIHFQTAGTKGTIRIVVDHYQLIRDPIYGALQFGVNSGAEPKWHAVKVDRWKGHRAYIELLDDGPGEIVLFDLRFSNDAKLKTKAIETDPKTVLRKWRDGSSITFPEAAAVSRSLQHFQKNREGKLPEKLESTIRQFEDIGKDVRYDDLPRAIGMVEGTPQDSPVFIRGNPSKPGEIVPRRFLEVLGSKPFTKGSGRLELAEQLLSPENPLVRRVIVNRVWQHLMGEGIVASVDDFGVQGSPPTHPELLDWLATDFAKDGWSIKKLIRKIVLTDAYQQASRTRPDAATADPRNQYLHRANLKRLQAEQIRDSMLAISGKLNEKREGPGVPPYLTPNMQGRGRPGKSGPMDGEGRRSIYLQVRRNFLSPMLTAFDLPTPFTTMGRRNVSNVPGQALTMLNNPLVHQLSEALAKRVTESKNDETERIATLYRMAFSRKPSEGEAVAAREFLTELKDEPEQARWAALAHALMNAKEFLFIP